MVNVKCLGEDQCEGEGEGHSMVQEHLFWADQCLILLESDSIRPVLGKHRKHDIEGAKGKGYTQVSGEARELFLADRAVVVQVDTLEL